MKPIKGSIQWTWEDDEYATSYDFNIEYCVYPSVPATWENPGEGALAEIGVITLLSPTFTGYPQEAVGIVANFEAFLERNDTERKRVEEAIFEDANDKIEWYKEEAAEARYQARRDS